MQAGDIELRDDTSKFVRLYAKRTTLPVDHSTVFRSKGATTMTDQTPETQTETSVKKTRARVNKAVEEGVADAKGSGTAVILPALGESISKAVYGGCYHAAYYVTFGALAITRLNPR